MAHWAERYVDIPHDQLDCGELVEKVLREVFGREVTFPRKQSDSLLHRARLITRSAKDYATPVAAPFDGAGVLILARGRAAHIGLYCAIAQGYILHSDDWFGASVLEPVNRLSTRYVVQGYYAWL
ncbi:MAG: hypothetical protein ABS43_03550 [Bordetella sp. SCN 67-23]|nr:hypothetical protein [Burkholderiales bacterium]ODS75877.1 MAG: hypothetical protein ABS43_03550 [Bordetella sp. SCN 67-23]OJW91753.1 MAG: hypothetical protein BGO71_21580 [Burkholderiales bacterium 67-32]